MIIALTVVIIVFIMVFQNVLPSALVNILILIVGVIGIIWAYIIYVGILNRDSVDFDKINSIRPDSANDMSGNVLVNSINAGNISKVLKLNQYDSCVGNNCCDAGTIYDTDKDKCVIPKSGFTSISQAYQSGDLSLRNYNDQHTSLIFSSYT